MKVAILQSLSSRLRQDLNLLLYPIPVAVAYKLDAAMGAIPAGLSYSEFGLGITAGSHNRKANGRHLHRFTCGPWRYCCIITSSVVFLPLSKP